LKVSHELAIEGKIALCIRRNSRFRNLFALARMKNTQMETPVKAKRFRKDQATDQEPRAIKESFLPVNENVMFTLLKSCWDGTSQHVHVPSKASDGYRQRLSQPSHSLGHPKGRRAGRPVVAPVTLSPSVSSMVYVDKGRAGRWQDEEKNEQVKGDLSDHGGIGIK
jgi:hypothetical protein